MPNLILTYNQNHTIGIPTPNVYPLFCKAHYSDSDLYSMILTCEASQPFSSKAQFNKNNHKKGSSIATGCNALFCVWDLRNQHQAGNKCMLPECCAAHHDMARPDDEQRNDEDNGTKRLIHTLFLRNVCVRLTSIIIIITMSEWMLQSVWPNDEWDIFWNNLKTSVSYGVDELLSLTCWKIHRWGKVLEMSSLISSRLDSRSDEPASGRQKKNPSNMY